MENKLIKFLRWSEAYTKTDMVYMAKGGFWLSFGQVASAASSFLISVAFANLVPKSVYGVYRYIISVSSTLSSFSLTGFGTAIMQSVSRGYENILKYSVWINIKWSFLITVASTVGAIYYFINDNHMLAISMLFVGTFTPIINSTNLAHNFINGKKDFKTLGIYTALRTFIPALSLIITMLITENIVVIIAIYFFSNLFMSVLIYRRTLQKYKPNDTRDPDILDYSKKLSITYILAGLASQADKIIMFTQFGAIELATYGIAISFPEQIKSLFRNLNLLIVPKLASNKTFENKLFLKNKTIKLALLVILCIIVYIIVSPLIYKIFFPKYPEAIIFTQIYAISMLGIINWIPNSVLTAFKLDKELFRITTIGSIVQLVLLFSFVQIWGIWGIIIAKILSTYINMFLNFFVVARKYKY